MLSRRQALTQIFEKHGKDAIYIVPTGYIAREAYELFNGLQNVFYMQGSMGLSPGIGLGLAMFTDKDVVAINGDGGHLMHLGLTHTIRDENLPNIFVYVLDNGVHESVGSFKCPELEPKYPGITAVIKISCDGKRERVGVGFKENALQVMGSCKK